jgi:hypothetical protein
MTMSPHRGFRFMARRTALALRMVSAAVPRADPLGAACYCIMPGNRYVYGVTRNDRYYGNVNPYFNPHRESQTVPSLIK